jgi:hypothetical protein
MMPPRFGFLLSLPARMRQNWPIIGTASYKQPALTASATHIASHTIEKASQSAAKRRDL